MEMVFSCPSNELSCLVGNLFVEIVPPCEEGYEASGLVICGNTHSGNYGVLVIQQNFCCFKGVQDDIKAIRSRICVDGRCKHG